MEPGRSDPCPLHQQITALGRGEVDREDRDTQSWLERHPACRDCFRAACRGRLPEIPNYTVVREIGKGGFGIVYKVIHHAKERVEALKLLFNQNPLVASYFENEVHLIARLRHPHIATLYEAQLSEQPLYYTMEFVEGLRLNEYIQQNACSVAERIEILIVVARAMHYAHEHDVVHRDLKPQNVLIDADGQPHIVDFGIAKKLNLDPGDGGPESWMEGPIGTRGYIAPEQAQGRDVDARADIFSLGALLFHCLTGEPSRYAREAGQRRRTINKLGLRHPDDLDAIIRRCVANDPARRYPSADALADDLRNYLSGRPVNAYSRPGRLYRANRLAALLVREHPWSIRVLGLAALACLLTMVAWGLRARQLAAPVDGGGTVLIRFGSETLAGLADGEFRERAPLASAGHAKSWRVLHGWLMEQLAHARPRVVAWDYYFPDPQPEFDARFARGAARLQAPVIVGARQHDDEGRLNVAASIRAVVDDVAPLYAADPSDFEDEFEVVYAVERGYDPPRPGLALRAFAACRFPQAEPVIRYDNRRNGLSVFYRQRRPEQDGFRWKMATDWIPLARIVELRKPAQRARLRPGDRVAEARVPATSMSAWASRTVEYRDVLLADPPQLRTWFDGKAVLIGQMLPGVDVHRNGRGEAIFGCHVHAAALDALLSRAHTARLGRAELLARHVGWAVLAGLWLAVATPWTSWRRPGSLAAAGLAAIGAGLLITAVTSAVLTVPWLVELGLAGGMLLAGGGFGYWVKSLRAVQMQSAPGAITPAEASTLSGSALGTPVSGTVTPAAGSTLR